MTQLAPRVRTEERSGRPPNRALRRLLRRPLALFGAFVIVFFVVLAAFAPLLAPYDPAATDFLAVRQAPSADYLFGTDDVGRDVLSRLIFGARASLMAEVISVVIAIILGVPLGLVSGFYGGFVDELIMHFTDALLSFPFLILAVALAAALGPSLQNAMIAIGIASAPTFIRLTRDRCWRSRPRSTCRPPGRSAWATPASSSATSCPTASRRSSSTPP
jgi:ABC-type dipeptide/oligopeptide/nickel transport system permease subunit